MASSSRLPFLLSAAALAALLSVSALAAPEGGPAGAPPAGAPPVGAPPQPAPAMQGPNYAEGARLFDEAIRYVARGKDTIPDVTSFYARLDAKLELPDQQMNGDLRVWFQNPDKFRWELTANRATTTKILSGQQGWIVDAQGVVRRLHGTPDGAKDIAGLQDWRERLADLSKFLTLKGLKGPGVGFEFKGPTTGSGTYAGEWLKIVRHAPGNADITFWLAYGKDTAGQTHATFPGIVRIDGDPAKGYPQEDYVLQTWDTPAQQPAPGQPAPQPRDFRYPRTIRAFQKDAGKEATQFLFAILMDVKLNEVDPTRFTPPGGAAPAPMPVGPGAGSPAPVGPRR